MCKHRTSQTHTTGATGGDEAALWPLADALRGSLDAAEYKHVVLGLIFLKDISDAFEEHHAKLITEQAGGPDPEGELFLKDRFDNLSTRGHARAGADREDRRWKYGLPFPGNANVIFDVIRSGRRRRDRQEPDRGRLCRLHGAPSRGSLFFSTQGRGVAEHRRLAGKIVDGRGSKA